ncbi:MAG: PIN domain-containing protein [Chloroflexi bacterium]|nr:PIN domain-containing protein [Chloroflexota bacterium]
MYLLDTNIIVEVLFQQAKSSEAKTLLDASHLHTLYLTDFSLASVGVMLFRKNMHEVFSRLVDDLIGGGGIRLLHLEVTDMPSVASASKTFNLDFDDACQYAAAGKYNLTLVSFDTDFDRTERGRKTPAEVLQK